ncbi:MauE/DoxX family redox-associated membrane protein [Castellaniella caeni]|uniref:MauE/DoxX family redox-associated membrane protein n=1 Tax=Castellaniella caeni TaxID=266123 RepID=UPI00083031C5|nr:MauE/DoxX family redox-associated membrane protein [Castellaniella caeni]
MGDPIIVYSALAVLVVVLWLGAFDKLRHFAEFEAAVSGYRLLPTALQRPFAVLFVLAELASGALLLLPAARASGALAALGVVLLASAGVVVNLLRGNTDVSCGCGGLAQASTGLSWWLVLRNGLLAALAVIVGAGMGARPLGWLDGLTFFGLTLSVLALYLVFNQLLASHLQMQKRSQS